MLWPEMCKDVSLILLCHNSSVILIFWKISCVVTIDFQQHFQAMAVPLDLFLVEKINATVHPCSIVVCIWLEKIHLQTIFTPLHILFLIKRVSFYLCTAYVTAEAAKAPLSDLRKPMWKKHFDLRKDLLSDMRKQLCICHDSVDAQRQSFCPCAGGI